MHLRISKHAAMNFESLVIKKKSAQKLLFLMCTMYKNATAQLPKVCESMAEHLPRPPLSWRGLLLGDETRTGQMLANVGAWAQHPLVEGRSP